MFLFHNKLSISQTHCREAYCQKLFNGYASHPEDHLISGWSREGLRYRIHAYFAVANGLGISPYAKILDLGCGPGTYSRIWSERGYRTVGIDYAWTVVKEALRRKGDEGADFACGSIYSLPFRGETFAHVLCIGVFQTINEHRSAIKEIHRVLSPGGVVILMTLNRLKLFATIRRMLDREDRIYVKGKLVARLKTYFPAPLVQDFKELGFAEIKVLPVQVLPKPLSMLSPAIAVWNKVPFLRFLTAPSFMVVATKR